MMDLTPLEVRNKRGDFKKIMRGYDPHDVDAFLEIAADRLEMLVRENIQLRERTQTLQNQVEAQIGREQAVQDALVTAQALRADIQSQSQRQAETVVREAEVEARRVIAEAEAQVSTRLRDVERQLDHARDSIRELERRRVRFLMEFRSLLERQMDVVQVEAGRAPFEARAIDLDLSGERERFTDIPDLETLLAGSGERLEPSTSGDAGPPSAADAISDDSNAPDRAS
jgi:cell division initiation protein